MTREGIEGGVIKAAQKLVRRVLPFLPSLVRQRVIRRMVKPDFNLPKQLSFRLAETREELEAAYRILHDAYVEMGYSKSEINGLRVTKYFALPTTSTLIALWEDQVIGTVSIIRDSPLGLPMENIFDLSHFRQQRLRFAEVSSLAIDKNFRKGNGFVFLPLCKFFYEYVKNCMDLDLVTIAVNPLWLDFYQGLMFFKKLQGKAYQSNYEFANGAPAVGMYLPLDHAFSNFKKHYADSGNPLNLFEYFVNFKSEHFQFPNRVFKKSMDPVMDPEKLKYFFSQKSRVFQELSDMDRLLIQNMYPRVATFQKALPETNLSFLKRPDIRFEVRLSAFHQESPFQTFQVRNLSSSGLLIEKSFQSKAPLNIQISIAEGQTASLQVQPIRKDKEGWTAVRILKADSLWTQYIDYLESDFFKFKRRKLKVAKAL